MTIEVTIRLKTADELTTLARDWLLDKVLITNDERTVMLGFRLLISGCAITNPEDLGAVVGYYKDALGGRTVNGVPIFGTCGFLHKADLEPLSNKYDAMAEAIGMPKLGAASE